MVFAFRCHITKWFAFIGSVGYRSLNSATCSCILTSCSGWSNGNGRSSTSYTSVKIAVVAPIPTASVRTAVAINPGALASCRSARRISRTNASIADSSLLPLLLLFAFAFLSVIPRRESAFVLSSGHSPSSNLQANPGLTQYPHSPGLTGSCAPPPPPASARIQPPPSANGQKVKNNRRVACPCPSTRQRMLLG